MTQWFRPAELFDGQDLHDDMAIAVTDGLVTDMQPRQALGGAFVQYLQGVLTPGFVDLQVNGGGGALVNNQPTADGISAIAEAHRALGTIAILPTIITDAPPVLEYAAQAVLELKDDPAILGLHIEGPHINPAKRGTHAAEHIRPFDELTLSIVQTLREAGVPVMLTLAPEAATLDQISALAQMGVVVSLGHSGCDSATATAAFRAGASAVTHLYNAMSGLSGRAPGLAGAAINSAAYVGMICDGVHVEDTMLGLAIRARPLPDRCFLVSDAMATVGGPDSFTLYEQTIQRAGDCLINAEGNLAGAHTNMAAGLARLVAQVGVPLEAALRMVVTTPAKLIGAPELASLVGRHVDDILHLAPDLTVAGTLAKVTR